MDTNEKHIYAVDLTHDRKNMQADETPFHAVILPDALQERRDAAARVFGRGCRRNFQPPILPSICAWLGGCMLFSFALILLKLFLTGNMDRMTQPFWRLGIFGAVLAIPGFIIDRLYKKHGKDPKTW